MKKLRQLLIIVTGQVLFVSAVTLVTPHVGYGQKTPNPVNVKVTNTSSEPVPVSGSVSVSDTVAVTGTVSLANTPSEPVPVTGTVNIANTVLVRTVVPAESFSLFKSFQRGDSRVVSNDPPEISYAITSLTISNNGTATYSVGLNGIFGALNSNCSHSGVSPIPVVREGPHASVPPGETVHLPFPQPFLMRAAYPGFSAARSCVYVSLPFMGAPIDVTVVGYRF